MINRPKVLSRAFLCAYEASRSLTVIAVLVVVLLCPLKETRAESGFEVAPEWISWKTPEDWHSAAYLMSTEAGFWMPFEMNLEYFSCAPWLFVPPMIWIDRFSNPHSGFNNHLLLPHTFFMIDVRWDSPEALNLRFSHFEDLQECFPERDFHLELFTGARYPRSWALDVLREICPDCPLVSSRSATSKLPSDQGWELSGGR